MVSMIVQKKRQVDDVRPPLLEKLAQLQRHPWFDAQSTVLHIEKGDVANAKNTCRLPGDTPKWIRHGLWRTSAARVAQPAAVGQPQMTQVFLTARS